jgi:SPOR domain
MYDDAPRARRHGGLATALALIGCAMLGTAGAYAYRSYTGHPSATQPPPVITADSSTPTKIVPVPAADPQSGRPTQDRLANAGKEQVISKQEEPVALKELGTQAAPRVVLPAPVAPVQPGAMAPAGLNEPKRVKPIAIGPDGNELSGRPAGGPPAPAPASTASRPAPAPAAPRAAAPAPSSGGPLSLQPQADEPAAAPAPRSRQAVVAPPPTRPAAEPSTGSTGGFVVQLSSQKSESEAQSAFRSLQAKFPNELGSRQPIIRRADLGAKGVFFRTMVGPFASAQEASQFCSSYKSAGGQCMVPSN